MNFELFVLGGYGQFVWPSFILTFLVCFYLYLITKIELTKLEKIYQIKFRNEQIKKIKFSREKETKKEALPIN